MDFEDYSSTVKSIENKRQILGNTWKLLSQEISNLDMNQVRKIRIEEVKSIPVDLKSTLASRMASARTLS